MGATFTIAPLMGATDHNLTTSSGRYHSWATRILRSLNSCGRILRKLFG